MHYNRESKNEAPKERKWLQLIKGVKNEDVQVCKIYMLWKIGLLFTEKVEIILYESIGKEMNYWSSTIKQ